MEEKQLTCIGCPKGCSIIVILQDGIILNICGYNCKTGKVYAQKEVTNPTRNVTTTVRVINGESRLVPVKTQQAIPKGKIAACMEAVKKVKIEAPIKEGEILIKNVAETSVDIVATKTVLKSRF